MKATGRKFRSLLAAAVVTALAACGDGDSTGPGGNVANTNFEASEDFSVAFAVTTQNVFTVRGINGNIEIIGSAAATEVTIAGTKTVRSESVQDAQNYLSNLEVNVTSTATAVGAQTVQPPNNGGRTLIVDYRITVPSSLRVDVLNTNGNVDVASIDANVAVISTNGNVELDDITGNASVTLTNGNIELDNLIGSATALSTNGNVVGDVVLPLNGSLSLRTTNGNAQLAVPQSTSADVAASLANGQISVTNLTFTNLVQTPTSLTGTLGAGEGTIDVTTVNGDVDLNGV